MKLFYSPFHSFAHKALVTAHEAGLWEQVTLVPTFPFRNLNKEFVTGQYDLSEIAPLGKVPCLGLEDGRVLYASQTVIEYLDANRANDAPRLYPEHGAARWDALTRLALGDAIFEFAVNMSMEAWIEEENRRASLYTWLWPKIIAALDSLEATCDPARPFDIGDVGMLQGISYMGDGSDTDPLYPNYNWRNGRPNLSAWYDEVITRRSVQTHLNKSYEGDLSPENHRRHVEEVLAARQKFGVLS